MEKYINELNITIPIVHIKGMVYLIGTNKTIASFNGDILVVRVGGGYQKFEEYIPSNHRFFER